MGVMVRMGNIKDIYDYHIGITLGGKAKKFKWSYDGEKIMVNKDIGK